MSDLHKFQPNFMIGCASASYQVEGGWNADDKGENIWDYMTHTQPDSVKNKDNGDIACDSYHKYKEDVQLIKDIGFAHYRFSISWSRVLPTGHDNVVSKAGLAYYHNLIDELKSNEIEPMVTLYHWDLPQSLQELGGWTNPLMADYFEAYARVMFKEFGDKVKWWITINEPLEVIKGYGRALYAPMLNQHGVADYLAAHTLLRAHAKAYHVYNSTFRAQQRGRIGITLNARFVKPLSNTKEDELAAVRSMEFENGIFAHPIFSTEGDYPKILRERVDYNSKREGRSSSRLPVFTKEEVQQLKGSSDFFGLNHYTSRLATSGLIDLDPSMLRDSGALDSFDPSWKTGKSPWLKVVPWGLRGILNRIRTEYNNPPVFITENGYSSDSSLEDTERIQYYHDYLEEMLKAIYEDNCHVLGYTAWSILDNFEWLAGYTERFGLCYVDFDDPKRPRKKKQSAEYFKKMIATRELPDV
ncbi:myrosinase 1 [Macrosteles quadrilineatus]|uniref:myrosinase 1 n=1 Tax=Macrosteles quadrilineatus TaxID=74068 RepID=UPI0023E2B575|nr:myrosinase 1 [Macrosteles quadrilineatus]XP_054261941.1 myrosinase 1 [Macrosteles quadrilineatus]